MRKFRGPRTLRGVIQGEISLMNNNLFKQLVKDTELYEVANKKLYFIEIDRFLITESLARKINK